jgi:hypothetical protein
MHLGFEVSEILNINKNNNNENKSFLLSMHLYFDVSGI